MSSDAGRIDSILATLAKEESGSTTIPKIRRHRRTLRWRVDDMGSSISYHWAMTEAKIFPKSQGQRG
jgi:hypothetical protein